MEEEEIKKEIGKSIKFLRNKKNISQTELSRILSVTVASVSRWESGISIPSFTTLYDISNLFEVSIDELLGKYAYNNESRIEEIYVLDKIKNLIKGLEEKEKEKREVEKNEKI